jgi:hypothetical protein
MRGYPEIIEQFGMNECTITIVVPIAMQRMAESNNGAQMPINRVDMYKS